MNTTRPPQLTDGAAGDQACAAHQITDVTPNADILGLILQHLDSFAGLHTFGLICRASARTLAENRAAIEAKHVRRYHLRYGQDCGRSCPACVGEDRKPFHMEGYAYPLYKGTPRPCGQHQRGDKPRDGQPTYFCAKASRGPRDVRAPSANDGRRHTGPMLSWTEMFGVFHSVEDEPAMVMRDTKEKIWYTAGRINRHGGQDQPAVVYGKGTKIWYRFGLIHRGGDLPAICLQNGVRKWFERGYLHRLRDKPAYVDPKHETRWHVRGQLHRGHDRPAVVGNEDQWRLAGGRSLRVSETYSDWIDWRNPAHAWCSRQWWLYGQLHRGGDRPAVEQYGGDLYWFRDGLAYDPAAEQ